MEDKKLQGPSRVEKKAIASLVRKNKEHTVPNTCSNHEMYRLSLMIDMNLDVYIPPRLTASKAKSLSYKQDSDGRYRYESRDGWRRRGTHRKFVLLEIAKLVVQAKHNVPFWCTSSKTDIDYLLITIGLCDLKTYTSLKDDAPNKRDYILMASESKLQKIYSDLNSIEKRVTNELFTLFGMKKSMQNISHDMDQYKRTIIEICGNALKSSRLNDEETALVRSWKEHAEEISDISTIKTASQFFTDCALSLEIRGGANDTTIVEPPPLTAVNSVITSRAIGDILDHLTPNVKPVSGRKPRPVDMYPAMRNSLFDARFTSNTNLAWLDTNAEGCSELLKVVLRGSLKNRLSEDTFNLMIADYWEVNVKLKSLTPIKGLDQRLPSVRLDYFNLDDVRYDNLLGTASKPKPRVLLSKLGQMPNPEDSNQGNEMAQNEPEASTKGMNKNLIFGREIMLTMDQVAEVDRILSDVDNNGLVQIAKNAASIIIKMQKETQLIVPAKSCIASSLLEGFISYCETFLTEPRYVKIKEKAGKYRNRCIYHFSNVTVKLPVYLRMYAVLVKFLKGCVKAMRVFNVSAEFVVSMYDQAEMNLQIAFATMFSSRDESCISEVEARIEDVVNLKLSTDGRFKADQKVTRNKGKAKGKLNLADISNDSIDEKFVPDAGDSDKMDDELDADEFDSTELNVNNVEHEDFDFFVNSLSGKKLRFSAISDTMISAVFYDPAEFISFGSSLTRNSAASSGLMALLSLIIGSDIFDLVMFEAMRHKLYTIITLAQVYSFWVYAIGSLDFNLRGVQLDNLFQDVPMTPKLLQDKMPKLVAISEFVRQILNGYLEKAFLPFNESEVFTSRNKKAAESSIYAGHKNFFETAELFVKCVREMPEKIRPDTDYVRDVIKAIGCLPESVPRPPNADIMKYVTADKQFKANNPVRGVLSIGSGQNTVRIYSIYFKIGYSYSAIYRVCGGVNDKVLPSANKPKQA